MSKQKNDDYYKKLYMKLKREKYDPVLELKKAIAWYQMLIMALLKKKFKGEITIVRQDVEAVEETENLFEDFDGSKNIVLKVIKTKVK